MELFAQLQALLDAIASRQADLDAILKRSGELSVDYSPSEKSLLQATVHQLQKQHQQLHANAIEHQHLLETVQANKDNFVEKLQQVCHSGTL